ncbi:hypothetical protein LXL04_013467 [Taraxacum kok-saghyz]
MVRPRFDCVDTSVRLRLDCVGTSVRLRLDCVGTSVRLRLDCVGTPVRLRLDCVGTSVRLRLDCVGTPVRLRLDCVGTSVRLRLDCVAANKWQLSLVAGHFSLDSYDTGKSTLIHHLATPLVFNHSLRPSHHRLPIFHPYSSCYKLKQIIFNNFKSFSPVFNLLGLLLGEIRGLVVGDCSGFRFRHREVLEYLKDYASEFAIGELVRFDTEVSRVSQRENGKWEVRSIQRKENEERTEEAFDAVVVGTGHYMDPRIAQIPGVLLILSNQYLHDH